MSVLAVVNNIPISTGNNKRGLVLTTDISIKSSGKNPLVPGKPTLAKEAIIKKNEKIGIGFSSPP